MKRTSREAAVARMAEKMHRDWFPTDTPAETASRNARIAAEEIDRAVAARVAYGGRGVPWKHVCPKEPAA